MWTQFWDTHSGGSQKEQWSQIYIEAPIEEAKVIFYNRFGHNPERVTCTCCGEDYSMSEEEDLAQITGFQRGCARMFFDKDGRRYTYKEARKLAKDGSVAWDDLDSRLIEEGGGDFSLSEYMPLDQYIASGKAHFIFAEDIKPEERVGQVPQQGYVWMG